MCLTKKCYVRQRKVKGRDYYMGWKVFARIDGRLHSLLESGEVEIILEDEWLQSESKANEFRGDPSINVPGRPVYKPGFHIFTRKRDVAIYRDSAGEYTVHSDENSIYQKVYYTDVEITGVVPVIWDMPLCVPTVVAHQMFVPSDVPVYTKDGRE